jgi:hypothetical protein
MELRSERFTLQEGVGQGLRRQARVVGQDLNWALLALGEVGEERRVLIQPVADLVHVQRRTRRLEELCANISPTADLFWAVPIPTAKRLAFTILGSNAWLDDGRNASSCRLDPGESGPSKAPGLCEPRSPVVTLVDRFFALPWPCAGLDDDDGVDSFLRPEFGDHGGVYWHFVPYMMQFMHD